jgi:uncharacterized protein YyaL (SSP411 family)
VSAEPPGRGSTVPNRLENEKSPYLLQHAGNPVDWYPWGMEALEHARNQHLPVLVSIGYSACHWCHVMAHESFEDADVARFMNQHFVNIKVDREERPDVDSIYMSAVQALSGQGGWPLNVFLTSAGKPFFGGTYFPPEPRHGLPSWTQVLEGVSAVFQESPDDVEHNAEVLTNAVRQSQGSNVAFGDLEEKHLLGAVDTAIGQGDWQHGGFGGAPKFPQPLAIEFLLQAHHRFGRQDSLDLALLTLARMSEGGIYDHLGGGFHRYAVDSVWLVPHFEKMLYDNALLARVYLYAFQITGNPRLRRVVEETLDYLLRDLRASEGSFYCSEDADSEGKEGVYYVWNPQSVAQAVGPELAALARARYGVTEGGNFEGKTVLTVRSGAEELAEAFGLDVADAEASLRDIDVRMLAARRCRVRPQTDSKTLVSWNALAIRALAEAGSVLKRQDYIDAALTATEFIFREMRPAGKLVRSFRSGPGSVPAFLDDYAFLAEALIALSQAAADPAHLRTAREISQEMIERFWDEDAGSFFDTPRDGESLVVRPRSLFDNPIPSGNASAARVLLLLEALTGEAEPRRKALSVLRAAGSLVEKAPLGVPYLLCAADLALATPIQIAVTDVGNRDELDGMLDEVFKRYRPNAVLSVGASEASPLLVGRQPIEGKTTAYVCEHFSCQFPVTEPAALARQLDGIRPNGSRSS